ncbi:MAG TPA: hypothetical protein VL986_08940 [Terracidiphilus sp.]|nr:hypothetical protein [Terracidiphilus sp.]
MFDHRYLAELSRALHFYLDLAFLICFALSAIRAAGTTQVMQASNRPTMRREEVLRRW